jgi:1-acyl-sn-glycerol-3-phosphate acyltransferase
MARFARGALSLALFALFGAGALALSAVMPFLRTPGRCHVPLRISWRVLLWLFEATRLIRVDRGGIPNCRGCVIVSNHPSLIDVVIFVALVPKTLFVAKHSLARNPFMSLIVRSVSLPDDERLPDAALRHLEKGWNVLVFPEGTRSPAGGMRPFRRGAANIALRCGAPVVCATLRQSRRILSKDQPPWDIGAKTVVYSTCCEGPFRFARRPDETPHAAAVRVTAELRSRYEMPRLCGGLRGVAAVVPVFNPEPALPGLCRNLLETFGTVVVVDDGSVESRESFQSLPEGVDVVRHARNLGKGAAIRTALCRLSGRAGGVVFLDGDGQHDPADAVRVTERMLQTGNPTLGVRDLAGRGVPRRSKVGNACMSFFLRLFCGARVSDTQTGLRAVPERLFGALLELPGDKFEYEMRMLAMLHLSGERIEEVPVKTIYQQAGGRVSHHRPFRDSVRIWFGLLGEAVFPTRRRQSTRERLT